MGIIADIFTDQNFIGAILASIAFLLIGFIFRRIGLFKDGAKEVLNVLVMKVAIPCMAFCAFMSDFNPESLASNALLLVLSLILYILFIVFSLLFFLKKDADKRVIYAILSSVGQLTFFAIPVLKAVYAGEHLGEVMIPASLMTLSFRLVVYIFCFLCISGTKLQKGNVGRVLKSIFVNPIMIAMGAGLLVWLLQNVVWQVDVGGVSYGFLRIDKTLPALYHVFAFGDALATPLCMILIGVSLGDADFLSALKNKTSWLIALLRMFALPLLTFGICCAIQAFGWIHFNEYSLAAIVIGMDAPTSAVVVAYCNDYNREAYVASDSILLSTLLSVLSIPLFFVLIKFAVTWPLFA